MGNFVLDIFGLSYRGEIFLILRYFILECLLDMIHTFSDIDFVSNLSLKDNFVVEHLLK